MRMTSLLLVEERLLEAQYFARRLRGQRNTAYVHYELNAFVAAARSVTFLLQKEMSAVTGFRAWWSQRRALLKNDAAATFFLELRNFSQKEGRISLVGSRRETGARWTYRFAGGLTRVPAALLNRDVADCCLEHAAKLAHVVLDFADAFPYQACPRNTLTVAGTAALGLSIRDIEQLAGFPPGWLEAAPDQSTDAWLSLLSRYVDGVDFHAIRRIAAWKPRKAQATMDSFSERILTSMVSHLEADGKRPSSGQLMAGVAADVIAALGIDDSSS